MAFLMMKYGLRRIESVEPKCPSNHDGPEKVKIRCKKIQKLCRTLCTPTYMGGNRCLERSNAYSRNG
jgi:hypothetical protein